jgi:hypothetical protein
VEAGEDELFYKDMMTSTNSQAGLTSTVMPFDSMHPYYEVMKMALFAHPPKNPQPQVKHGGHASSPCYVGGTSRRITVQVQPGQKA